jgi:hypothetical protein
MIELLLVQTITTAVLAALVIKLRRELYPMLATAGSADDVLTPLMRQLMRHNALIVKSPQLLVSRSIIRMRQTTSEELFLRYRVRVYNTPIDPGYRYFYKEWKEWKSGSNKYDCRVKEPRGLARLYNKAIKIICTEKKEEKRPREIIIPPKRMRRRGIRVIEIY